jgi:hypothetical protein
MNTTSAAMNTPNTTGAKKATPYSPVPQLGITLLQMLGTIGAFGLLGAWLFPLLLAWIRS